MVSFNSFVGGKSTSQIGGAQEMQCFLFGFQHWGTSARPAIIIRIISSYFEQNPTIYPGPAALWGTTGPQGRAGQVVVDGSVRIWRLARLGGFLGFGVKVVPACQLSKLPSTAKASSCPSFFEKPCSFLHFPSYFISSPPLIQLFFSRISRPININFIRLHLTRSFHHIRTSITRLQHH